MLKDKNITTRTQTSADLKFLNGSFIEASALYAEALLHLDGASSDVEMAGLLTKLGGSQYAAGLFQEALGTYKRLLELQDQCGLSEREKISTYLKLAQIHDLTGGQQQAESEFRTAYEMAELHLPPQHWLWRSVIGSYAGWLTKSGLNPRLLAKLQHEVATPAKFEVSSGLEDQPTMPNDQNAVCIQASRPASDIDLQRNSEMLSGVLPSRHDVAMRKSMRSFFNDETAYQGESTHREPDTEDKEVQKHLSRLMPVALVALVLIVAVVVITLASARPGATEFPSFYREFSEKTFITSDGSLSFRTGSGGLALTSKGISRKVKPVFWKGTFRDEMSLLRGDFRNYVWLYPSARGLQDQTSIEFFPETEIEGRTIRLMHNIAVRAQSFYVSHGRYPLPHEIQSMFLYRNPGNQNIEQLPVYSMYSYYKNAATRSKGLEGNFESGQNFNEESVGKPGSVAVLCVINKQHALVEVPDSPVESQIMYLHSFDRNGQLIRCPGSDKTLLLTLVSGKTTQTEVKNILGKYSDATIIMSAKQPPDVAAVFFKYFAWLISLAGISGYLLWLYARFSKKETLTM